MTSFSHLFDFCLRCVTVYFLGERRNMTSSEMTSQVLWRHLSSRPYQSSIFESFEANNGGQSSRRCTFDQWLDLIGVTASWEAKYFEQEPIRRKFDFSGVYSILNIKYSTLLKSNLRCIGSCSKYLASQYKFWRVWRLSALHFLIWGH